MNKAFINLLPTLTFTELREGKDLLYDEQQRRMSKGPYQYGCCECNYISKDFDEVVEHHATIHKYPEEDAEVSVIYFYK